MNRLLLTILAVLAFSASWADDKTDVTTKYVTNPSFEQDNIASLSPVNNNADGLRGYEVTAPKGWTVNNSANAVSLIVTKDCYTDNNFGLVTTLADGSQAYYLRMGWFDGTKTTSLRQTIKDLPKGKYQLTASIRSAYANSASSTFGLLAGRESTSIPFAQGSTGCFTTTTPWNVEKIDFEQVAESNVTIGLNVNWVSGGSCIMIDNVRLYSLPDGYVEPIEPVYSPTEGIVTSDFVGETQMKHDLLQMLANFATYMKNDFETSTGLFMGESTGNSNEAGVRTNADLSMICAFLVKYGKDKVKLPEDVTWEDLETMAMKSLVFAYSTHKANRLKTCNDGNYWGSTSANEHVWESSLWAMSVAYSAFFQWDNLTRAQRNYIYQLLKAECNYELERSIPTGYVGDTKAEENGWEADVLAVTLGLFPDDPLAPKWFQRLREFAINSYSQKDDATNNTVIDPDYDQTTIASLYRGQNLYDDYTLQNHNYFHTSYQNVVIQELGEAALALKLFQKTLYGEEMWKTNALMHNNDRVMQEVLYWLALADGELAMPNGNDWSLVLYDQITSYSTNACFLRDPHALMLENLAYKMIKARQTTTTDGSWLLRPDVGARRMGVEAHRVMMSFLMHEVLSTADLTPTKWDDFNSQYAEAKVFNTQNIVRAATDSRFTCFSWSTGIDNGEGSYTGYIAANSVDKNKIIVPFRANNTGNFLGWYDVQGKDTNATPVIPGFYQLQGNSYVMNGELNTNDATLNNRFALYSTPGNAVIYIDYVRANADATINAEKGGLMAISVDELTKTKRTLYYPDYSADFDCLCYTHKQLDGSTFTILPGPWVNVDDAISIVNTCGKSFAFGEKANNNSIMTAKLYGSFNNEVRKVKKDDVVDCRAIAYYINMTAEETNSFFSHVEQLKTPEGWNGVIVPDGSGASDYYMLLSNFDSDQPCELTAINCSTGKPVFTTATNISEQGATATFVAEKNHSVVNTLKFFIGGNGLTAVQEQGDSTVIYVLNLLKGRNDITVTAVDGGKSLFKKVTLDTSVMKIYIRGGELLVEEAATFPDTAEEPQTKDYRDITSLYLTNASFEDDLTYGKENAEGLTVNGTTYKPCYVNTIGADDPKWPNILPVKGWTPANGLNGGSKFCRMYSMPYSKTQYCVSPSDVGNYAARCPNPLTDESCGDRVLTVLNSWDDGGNAITQYFFLHPSKYRLLLDMRYECPNQLSNNGRVIVTTDNNINTSLTGLRTRAGNDYRYPSAPNIWQQLCYDLDVGGLQSVTLSLGFETSASLGAANNTLLYIDNVRLYVLNGDADGNGLVDSKDIDALVKHIIGQETANFNPDAADINGDRQIDIADIAALIKILQSKR